MPKWDTHPEECGCLGCVRANRQALAETNEALAACRKQIDALHLTADTRAYCLPRLTDADDCRKCGTLKAMLDVANRAEKFARETLAAANEALAACRSEAGGRIAALTERLVTAECLLKRWQGHYHARFAYDFDGGTLLSAVCDDTHDYFKAAPDAPKGGR